MAALYVVPLAKAPADLTAAVSDAVKQDAPEVLKQPTLQFVGTALMELKIVSGDKVPVPIAMFSAMGTSDALLSKIKNAKQFLIIRTLGKPAWPPYHEFAARSAASAMAKQQNNCVIDMVAPSVMAPSDAIKKLPTDKDKPVHLEDWFTIFTSMSDDGAWMTTKGLKRMGLPELQALNVPPQLYERWSNVITATTYNIMARFSQVATIDKTTTEFTMPATIELSASDFAMFMPDDKIDRAVIHLRFDGAKGNEEQFLTMTPPPRDARSIGRYLCDIYAKLFGAEHEIVQAPRSEAMEKAMAEARSGLTNVRKRFIEGKLPKDSKLIVKFPLKHENDTEYLWAFVTAWKNPDELDAISGNDSNLGGTIRNGDPVHLKTNTLVDWAVMTEDGIVEGGFTNKVLQR